jgi:hypothetical protein
MAEALPTTSLMSLSFMSVTDAVLSSVAHLLNDLHEVTVAIPNFVVDDCRGLRLSAPGTTAAEALMQCLLRALPGIHASGTRPHLNAIIRTWGEPGDTSRDLGDICRRAGGVMTGEGSVMTAAGQVVELVDGFHTIKRDTISDFAPSVLHHLSSSEAAWTSTKKTVACQWVVPHQALLATAHVLCEGFLLPFTIEAWQIGVGAPAGMRVSDAAIERVAELDTRRLGLASVVPLKMETAAYRMALLRRACLYDNTRYAKVVRAEASVRTPQHDDDPAADDTLERFRREMEEVVAGREAAQNSAKAATAAAEAATKEVEKLREQLRAATRNAEERAEAQRATQAQLEALTARLKASQATAEKASAAAAAMRDAKGKAVGELKKLKATVGTLRHTQKREEAASALRENEIEVLRAEVASLREQSRKEAVTAAEARSLRSLAERAETAEAELRDLRSAYEKVVRERNASKASLEKQRRVTTPVLSDDALLHLCAAAENLREIMEDEPAPVVLSDVSDSIAVPDMASAAASAAASASARARPRTSTSNGKKLKKKGKKARRR